MKKLTLFLILTLFIYSFQSKDNTFQQITKLYEKGKISEAIERLKEHLQQTPTPEGYLLLAKLYKEIGALSLSKEAIKKAIEMDPSKSDYYSFLGSLYSFLGDWEQSLKYFEKSVQLNPQDFASWFNIGNLYLRFGKPEEAIRAFEKFLSIQEDDQFAYVNTALSLLFANREKEALEIIDKGIKKLNNSTFLKHALARILATAQDESLRNPEKAYTIAHEIATTEPSEEALLTVGLSLASLGDFQSAYKTISETIKVLESRNIRNDLLPYLYSLLDKFNNNEIEIAPWYKLKYLLPQHLLEYKLGD